MRLLVVGGTGFIGPHVIRELVQQGHTVAVLHRGTSETELPASVERIHGDRIQLPSLRNRIADWHPEVVLDLILGSGAQAEALVSAIRGIARRVVAASSGDVYRACGLLHGIEEGPLQPMPLTEDSDLRTKSQTYPVETLRIVRDTMYPWLDEEYDKIQVERAIMADASMPGTVVRLPMVYGPGDVGHRLFPILKRVHDSRPAILLEETAASWRGPRGYVENVAAAIALAAVSERAAGRTYNVAETPALTELEWEEKVARAAEWRGKFVILPMNQMPVHLQIPGNYAQHWVMDSSRIRAELGYRERVPMEEALLRTIAWEGANPPAHVDPARFDYAAEDAAFEPRSW